MGLSPGTGVDSGDFRSFFLEFFLIVQGLLPAKFLLDSYCLMHGGVLNGIQTFGSFLLIVCLDHQGTLYT